MFRHSSKFGGVHDRIRDRTWWMPLGYALVQRRASSVKCDVCFASFDVFEFAVCNVNLLGRALNTAARH